MLWLQGKSWGYKNKTFPSIAWKGQIDVVEMAKICWAAQWNESRTTGNGKARREIFHNLVNAIAISLFLSLLPPIWSTAERPGIISILSRAPALSFTSLLLSLFFNFLILHSTQQDLPCASPSDVVCARDLIFDIMFSHLSFSPGV